MNAPRLALKPRFICMWFCIMAVLALSLKAHSAQAEEPLTLAETIQLATQNQPLLQSLDDAAESSRQAAIAEGQLPDPKVKFGVINLPVTTSDALRYTYLNWHWHWLGSDESYRSPNGGRNVDCSVIIAICSACCIYVATK